MMIGMEAATTVQFAHAARALALELRARRLIVPGFRSPPRLAGADRTLRRRGTGASVAIRVRGRPWPAVLADMIDGVVATNGLVGVEADALRNALWQAVVGPDPSPTVGEPARVA